MRKSLTLAGALALLLTVPAAAEAHARVAVENGVAVYRGGGEVNYVTARAPGLTSTWSDSLVPLLPGAGCTAGPPVMCASESMDARLGDGDDRADVSGSGESAAFVEGGYGRDRILSGGGDNDVSGGPGDDAITIYSESTGVARGNGGDDSILTLEGRGSLYGGAGGDILVSAVSAVLVDGGDNDDDLVSYSGDMNGGPGHDVLIARGDGGRVLDGGRDGDWIVGGFGADTVFGGHGNDVIDVSGDEGEGPDVVHCGASTDTVYADPDDILDGECEHRLPGPMPSTPRVDNANAEADALLADWNPLL